MPAIIEPPEEPPGFGAPGPPLPARIGWFLGLAAAGAAVTALIAYCLKALLPT